jgi:DNA-binding IclR family transcriptional regulator
VRGRGYALDRQELEPNLCCVPGPAFDRTGIVVASIGVSGPDSRIDDTTIAAMVKSRF